MWFRLVWNSTVCVSKRWASTEWLGWKLLANLVPSLSCVLQFWASQGHGQEDRWKQKKGDGSLQGLQFQHRGCCWAHGKGGIDGKAVCQALQLAGCEKKNGCVCLPLLVWTPGDMKVYSGWETSLTSLQTLWIARTSNQWWWSETPGGARLKFWIHLLSELENFACGEKSF